MSQIAVQGVAVEFGGNTIIEDVTFTVNRSDRWGIVGRNGTGKTTLFNVIAGRLQPSRGSVARATGLRLTLLDQHRETGSTLTVWDAAALPFSSLIALETSLAEQAAQLAESSTDNALQRYDRDLERFAREGGYTFASHVDAVLQGLGFDPTAARTQLVANLSGGEAGRVALARQLVAPADVLLLDEPTNHLDLETTAWLEGYLRELDASVLVISHDRAFLENAVTRVLHLSNATATPYHGNYSAFVHQYAERRLAQQRAFDQQQRAIAAEEEYIRRNIAGQNSKQAKGRRKRLSRLERLSAVETESGAMALRIASKDRGGDQVMVAQDVRIAIGERVLIDDFSARVTRGEVIGLVGANGSGKSTLLKAIAGQRPTDGGVVRVGDSISLAYYRQDLTQVPLGKTLFSIIHDLRPMWERGAVQSHLGRFGFSGDAAQRVADDLSGGERARVALAMLVLAEAHFLLLDEPTNHLDVESIEALEDALDSYDGTVLLVSHDRELLRNTVTRVWSLDNSWIADFDASFEEFEESRARKQIEADEKERAEKAARQDAERSAARRRQQLTATERNALRALKHAVEIAEAEVHELETRAASLREQIEDPELYTRPDGTATAYRLKRELDDAEEALILALERWTNATDALNGATTH